MTITARLDEVAELNPRLKGRPDDGTVVSFLGMADVNSDGSTAEGVDRRFGDTAKGHTQFRRGDVLVAKITPCFENGKIAQASTRHLLAAGSTEFHVVRPDPAVLDGRYLHHYLRQPYIKIEGERRMTGSAGQRRVPEAYLAQLKIPLPSLDEQRRIATLLDQADALLSKRRQAISLLDDLARSIFHDMFGDTGVDGTAAPIEPLSKHLIEEARNGLSPSKGGGVENPVLTLSAITGSTFDKRAVKIGTFKVDPPASKRVDRRDFLVCRGNGNLNLVGLGCFPDGGMPEVVFPDTMIALRFDPEAIGREYLEYAWRTKAIRAQIEAGARTTNGTFKINQGVVESLQIPVPSIRVQEDFGQRIRSLKTVKEQQLSDLTALDELFGSLQARAFNGEL